MCFKYREWENFHLHNQRTSSVTGKLIAWLIDTYITVKYKFLTATSYITGLKGKIVCVITIFNFVEP